MLIIGRYLNKTESLLRGLNLLLHTQLGMVLFLRVYRRDVSASSPSQRRAAHSNIRAACTELVWPLGPVSSSCFSSRYRQALAAVL